MPRIDCFEHIKGNKKLEAHFASITKDMPENEQRAESIKLANEYYKILHSEVNDLNKLLRKKQEPLTVTDNSKEIEKVKETYAKQIEEISSKKPIVEEPKKEVTPPTPPKTFIQELTGNDNAVTINGSTEKERMKLVSDREKEVALSPKEKAESELAKKVKRFNELSNGRLGKGKTSGALLLNEIKKEARRLGFKVDGGSSNSSVFVKTQTAKGTFRDIKTMTKDRGRRSIAPNGVPLHQRSEEFQREFVKLMDLGVPFEFRNSDDNSKFLPSQEASALADIYDGIPSEQAELVLNHVQKAIETGAIEYGDKVFGFGEVPLSEVVAEAIHMDGEEEFSKLENEDIGKIFSDYINYIPEFNNLKEPDYESERANIENAKQPSTERKASNEKANDTNDKAKGTDEKNDSKVPTTKTESVKEVTTKNSDNGKGNEEAIQAEGQKRDVLKENQKAEGGKSPSATSEKSPLKIAKEARIEAKKKLDERRKSQGAISDPKEDAKALFEYHQALVTEAKEHIKEGVKSLKEFADAIGEKVTNAISKAWEEASGKAIYKTPEELGYGVDNADSELTGVSHRHTDEIKEALGLPTYEPSPMTDEEVRAEADKQVSNGVNVIDILKRWEAGKFNADTIQVETELVKRYIGHMESLDKMSDTDIDNYKRALNILENVGRLFGKGLRSRVGDIEKRPDSLAEFLVDEMWSSRVDVLTEEQKAKVEKEFNDIKAANDKLNEKIAELEKQQSLQSANNVVSKERKSAGRKRAIEDIKKERQDIVSSIKKKLKDSRSQFNATPVPYANELIAIAPDVAKLVRNYVEEGIVNLSEIVDGIHDIVKETSANIQKDDIVDIIAGKYNEPKKTKNEILTSIVSLKNQSKLISRLKDLEDGIEPKYERQKIKRNQEISYLRNKIDENSLHQLAKAKSNILAEISRLENDLESGNIAPAVKKEPIKLDREATILKDELIRLRKERAIRLLQEEYKNRTDTQKLKDMTIEVLNVPRTIMSSMDFSAPLRQGLVASVAHPTIAGKAFIEMFRQAVSQKRFDRWFQDVRESDEWPIMEQSGLYVADPHDYKLSAKEEQFMNNLAEKIPFIGKLIKGSERAYVSYLNKMRVDLFQQGADVLESMGMTFENSQEEYEGLASFINNSTGRGKLAKIGSVSLEDAAPVFNSIFFSPRLIASRLSLLNPMYYAKLPKYARIMALKDMSKFVGFGVSMLYLLKAAFGCEDNCTDCKNCIKVETDPRSTDFGKLRIGNTRYDVWGGFQQYARIIAQMASGQSKSATSGKINDIDGKGLFGKDRADVLGSFVRGKLSPIPATILDFAAGRNIIGEPMTLEAAAERNLLPLIYSDVKDAIKEDGAKALFTVGLPATFGVGVNTYDPKKNKNKN